MLRYKLISLIDGVATYEYYPEGDEDSPGTVVFEDGLGSGKVTDRSNRDSVGFYSDHLLRHFAGLGRFDESGEIAWF